jgi:seryl-tRNA synthetase
MLDQKRIRNNPDEIRQSLIKRNESTENLDKFLQLDEKRRNMLTELEKVKNYRNTKSEEIARLKREGKDADSQISEMKKVSDNVKSMESDVSGVEDELNLVQMSIPNVPHPTVPIGKSDDDNVEVRRWSEPTKFDFQPQAHWDIGDNLGILDFATASKVTGSRFVFLKGQACRMELALINFMMEMHTKKHGYVQVFPPYMVHRHSMEGTGQLPKFEEDAYKVEGTDYFLIPTAEVPVTNMYREQILDKSDLPIYNVAYSACFRSEAGSAGRDTRGLVRQHQFNKVEMVKVVEPEKSYEELEKLVNEAEDVLQALGIPYRVVNISTADLGFTAAKKYDLEVWMPSYDRYVEISSCSNCEDFQARRANIKYRPGRGQKTRYVHTLNGSGVAIGRTMAAILENYQQADGSVVIPEALRSYMGGVDKITKENAMK